MKRVCLLLFLAAESVACAGPARLDLVYISDRPKMEQLAVAASDCGFRDVRLGHHYDPPPGNVVISVARPIDRARGDASSACLGRWIEAHPELDIEILMR